MLVFFSLDKRVVIESQESTVVETEKGEVFE